MAKFQVKFTRPYTIIEGFTRVVEAPTAQAAAEIGAKLADGFNRDCPDDCAEIDSADSGDFCAEDARRVADDTAADYPEGFDQ